MQLSKYIVIPAVFVAAALLAVLAAWSAVGVIETVSHSAIERQLMLQGEDWAEVEADGLQVILSGTAPTETDRFQALSIAGGEVDASRVIDHMDVPSSRAVAPPRFSIEILRNDAGISMIGLVPAATDREELGERVGRITAAREVADLLESADYPEPEGWKAALEFAIFALEELPRSKISMSADRVEVEAIADSEQQKKLWEQDLARRAPGGLRVALNISAPRPVVTPFTARFVIDEVGARFDACTAGTESGRTKIVSAGIAAGVKGRPECTIALGVPSSDWPDAVATGVAALRDLGAGTITFSDADVTLVADASVSQQTYDRVVGELEAELPDVFSLHASRTAREDNADEGPPEFTATLSPEGLVQLRGRVSDEQQRTITESVARARFGIDNVYMATRLDQGLPAGWSVRVLAAIDALSHLDNGSAIVQPNLVELRGTTGDPQANAEISRLLSSKLGEAQEFRVNVTYDEALDPVAALPTPRECVNQINEVMRAAKITFAPGSVEIEARAGGTIDKIAEILKTCPDAPMEIGGHTDSQGSEELNKSLSQQRANSVLNALLARRVLTSNLTAYGYGEEQPIADNDTEEGREENRRIEFRLIGTTDLPQGEGDGAEGDGAEEDISEGAVQTADEDLGSVRPRPRPTDQVEATIEGAPQTAEADEVAATDGDTDDGEGSGDEPPMEAASEEADEMADDATSAPEAETTTSAPEAVEDTGTTGADAADEATDTETTDAEATDTGATDTGATDTDATDTGATDTEAAAGDEPATEAATSDPDAEETATETGAEAPDASASTDTEVTESGSIDTGTTDTETADAEPTDAEPAPETDGTPEADTTEADTTETDTDTEAEVAAEAEAAQELLGPAIVVHPELEGVKAPARPQQ